jgi:phage baseplate assembly protein gpV
VAKVSIQPEGVLTGWLPILSQSAGPGWGLICPPTVGQQVLVLPDLGDEEHGVILGGTWSTVDRPPQPATSPGGEAAAVQPGDAALVHSTGSFLRFSSDGTAFLNVAGAVNVAAAGNATVASRGNATVTAAGYAALVAPAIKLGAALTDTLRGFCTALFQTWAETHVHSNGNAGANTGPPTSTPPAGSVTSVVTGE